MQNLIKTFNTGAGYSQEGQRIAYMPLAHRGDATMLVAMVDADRGINYVLAVAYPYDDGAVLDAYLNNRTESNMWLPQAMKDLLLAAALAHGKEAPAHAND